MQYLILAFVRVEMAPKTRERLHNEIVPLRFDRNHGGWNWKIKGIGGLGKRR
jgi:hypothetical protein